MKIVKKDKQVTFINIRVKSDNQKKNWMMKSTNINK